jgi:aminoglycoside phosphotransferase (APT) family kinase protein
LAVPGPSKLIATVEVMSQETFADWLERRHSATAPRSLVNDQVQLAVGRDVATCRRLIVGQTHEVYDVTTTEERSVIVRISRDSDPRFEAARWAMDQARLHGVPTPEVLRIDRVQHDSEGLTIEVQERLPGTPIDQLSPSARRSTRLTTSLGAVIAALHSVPVDGLGYLQADGRAWDISFASIMLDLSDRTDELASAAQYWGVDLSIVNRGLQLLSRHEELYTVPRPTLIHGDLCPAHILVQDGIVTGVIDFEECSGGHPVFDFANWHATCPPDFDVSRLRLGYPDRTLFADSFECLFALALLRRSLWMLIVRRDNRNPFGLPRVLADIEHSFALLSMG